MPVDGPCSEVFLLRKPTANLHMEGLGTAPFSCALTHGDMDIDTDTSVLVWMYWLSDV